MTRCPKDGYVLVNGCCPICGGKQVKDVPNAPPKPFPVVPPVKPLARYWSPEIAA